MRRVKEALDNYWPAVNNYYRVIVQAVSGTHSSKIALLKKEKWSRGVQNEFRWFYVSSGNIYVIKMSALKSIFSANLFFNNKIEIS